jgi:hypothetical protein
MERSHMMSHSAAWQHTFGTKQTRAAFMEGATGVENQPTLHAFVVLGTDRLFLCHLTMYHMEEHMYQVVLRVNLPEAAHQQFREERAKYPRETYFIGNSPEDFMTIPQLQSGIKPSFKGDLFRGIPEQPEYKSWPWEHEKPVIKDVEVAVDRVVYYRHLSVTMPYPRALTYVLFGAGTEAHMTNYQTPDLDYDHVLSLSMAPDWLTQEQLQAGVHVSCSNIPTTPKNGKIHCDNPLTGQDHMVQYRGQGPAYPIRIGQHYWYSTKINNHHNPCA